MDDIKAAGWTRFKPVAGQPITEKDMKKVFKMVDMDKSGAISQLVCLIANLLIQQAKRLQSRKRRAEVNRLDG